MRDGWEDRVRERAYAIWEREGRPEGGAERHWTQAEGELRAEEGGGSGPAAADATGTATEEAGIGPDTRSTGGIVP